MSSFPQCFFVVRHRRRLPPAASCPHDDQAVTGKELRAADADEHQPEREHQASRYARDPIAQPVLREENRREIGAEGDEDAGEHRERKHCRGIEVGFRHREVRLVPHQTVKSASGLKCCISRVFVGSESR